MWMSLETPSIFTRKYNSSVGTEGEIWAQGWRGEGEEGWRRSWNVFPDFSKEL